MSAAARPDQIERSNRRQIAGTAAAASTTLRRSPRRNGATPPLKAADNAEAGRPARQRREPGEPGEAEREHHHIGDEHRAEHLREGAAPAAIGGGADDSGHNDEAEQIAARRSHEVGRTSDHRRGVGEDREAKGALGEIGEHGDDREPRPVGGGDAEHREGLERHRHRIEGNLDLGGDGEDHGAGDHQQDRRNEARGAFRKKRLGERGPARSV